MRPIRLLYVTPYVPSLLRVRPYNLIKHLSGNGHQVTVLAVHTDGREEVEAGALGDLCERVEIVRVPLHQSLWNCLRGWHTRTPLQALYCHSPAVQRRLNVELGFSAPHNRARNPFLPYDLVHIEHLRAAMFGLEIGGLPRVYDSVDSISRLFEKTSQMGATRKSRWTAALDLKRTRRFEAGLVGRFDRILTTSEHDKSALADLAREFPLRSSASHEPQRRNGSDSPISVLPNGVDLEYFTPSDAPPDPATLICVGRMSYHANVAGVLYFVREVLPHIWARRPDVRFSIIGDAPAREIRQLAVRHAPRVTVTGYVPDVRPHLARATVSVSPMVYAVGIQNKVLEAMATATPVVATPAACPRPHARDEQHLLLGKDAPDFARQVLRLLEDPAMQRRIGWGGRRYVETHHDWSHVARELEEIYRHEVAAFGQRATPAAAVGL